MIAATLEIKGLDALGEALQQLDLKKQTQAIRAAARYGMKPVLDQAKANLDARGAVHTGTLRDSLYIRAKIKRTGPYAIEAGVSIRNSVTVTDPEAAAQLKGRTVRLKRGRKVKGLKNGKVKVWVGAGWRWHFVEFGVPARGIAAKPFLRPAMDQRKAEVLQRFREKLARTIDVQVAKARAAARS